MRAALQRHLYGAKFRQCNPAARADNFIGLVVAVVNISFSLLYYDDHFRETDRDLLVFDG